MGDLISIRLGRNQLPPKTGREHDDYCFSLITVLISKVAAHCEGPFCFLFWYKLGRKRAKRRAELETILPNVCRLGGNDMIA